MSTEEDNMMPLRRIESQENGPESWSEFPTPEELLKFIEEHYAVEVEKLTQLQRITTSETQPSASSVWIYPGTQNTPPFIGVPADGVFVRFYKYPPNVPFIAPSPDLFANEIGVRAVTPNEILAWGLPTLTGTAQWMVLDISLPQEAPQP